MTKARTDRSLRQKLKLNNTYNWHNHNSKYGYTNKKRQRVDNDIYNLGKNE